MSTGVKIVLPTPVPFIIFIEFPITSCYKQLPFYAIILTKPLPRKYYEALNCVNEKLKDISACTTIMQLL